MTRITRSFRCSWNANVAAHETVDVVGPICESGDFFARDRELPVVNEGDLLAILDAGAYGMVLASNYNTRRRPAEVLVEGKSVKLIRRRETMDDLLRPEIQCTDLHSLVERVKTAELCSAGEPRRLSPPGIAPSDLRKSASWAERGGSGCSARNSCIKLSFCVARSF